MRLNSARYVLTAAALYVLLRTGAQTVSIRGGPPVLLVLVSIALSMLLQLAIIRGATGLPVRPGVAGWLILAFAMVVAGLTVLLGTVKMPVVTAVAVWALRDLALILFAVSLGSALSVVVREPNILLPVAIVAAVVDFWSVNYGPLGMLLATKPEVVEAAAVQVPVVGHVMPIGMIGVGDFVFLALYFAVMSRYRMNVAGAFWWGFVLLTATMFAVIRVEWLSAVPALVPIAVAVIVSNTKHFKLKRDEVVSTVVVGVILIGFLILSILLAHPGR